MVTVILTLSPPGTRWCQPCNVTHSAMVQFGNYYCCQLIEDTLCLSANGSALSGKKRSIGSDSSLERSKVVLLWSKRSFLCLYLLTSQCVWSNWLIFCSRRAGSHFLDCQTRQWISTFLLLEALVTSTSFFESLDSLLRITYHFTVLLMSH